MFLCLLSSCKNDTVQIVDEDNKTVFFDGVSCKDKESVVKHLTELSFQQIKKDTLKIDGVHLIEVFRNDHLTCDDMNRLCYDLTDLNDKEEHGLTVLIESDLNGKVTGLDITDFTQAFTQEQKDRMNKRLNDLFKTSRVSNEINGYKSYITDNVELYFPDTLDLQIIIH